MALYDISHKSEEPPTECEVKVDVKLGEMFDERSLASLDAQGVSPNDWVRIPVTECDLWINKDGPSDLSRTAKVKFPAEWDGHSILQYINGFSSQNNAPYDECRIWFRDDESGSYRISHYGYIGGVGPAAESGVFKFWVYDPADLMRAIQVSKSFGNPTIQQVLDFALNGSDEQGKEVGFNHRTVFDGVGSYIAGVQEVAEQKQDMYDLDGNEKDKNPLGFDTSDIIDDAFDWFFGTEQTRGVIDHVLDGQKRFQLNRHNMVDLLDWFANEIGGKWHFEPTPHNPVLFFDNTASRGIDREDGEISRRYFKDGELSGLNDRKMAATTNVADFTERAAFDTVDVLDNDALMDIKPFNKLYLYGEATTYRERHIVHGGLESDKVRKQDYNESGSPGAYTSSYPYVEVEYEPLFERAGGYEYAAPAIESDVVYLDQAKREAIDEFRQHLSEETEGSITLRGEPNILPYDYITVVPVCNDTFPNADANPITYEINSVKHHRSATEPYKTTLGVSLAFDESQLDITAEYQNA